MSISFVQLIFFILFELFGLATSNHSNTQLIKCNELRKPENGYFINGYCSNSINSACGLGCLNGYRLRGSSFRHCQLNNITNSSAEWTGIDTYCQIVACRPIELMSNVKMNCTRNETVFGTECFFQCPTGYFNLGSSSRLCLPIGIWSGIKAKCKKLEPGQLVPTETPTTKIAKSTTISTTTNFESHFEDLSGWTISFGFSFKKVLLEFLITSLPATSSIWLRTNYTKNSRLLGYSSACFNTTILTNENSTLMLRVTKWSVRVNRVVDYLFNLEKPLVRNKWVQLVFRHNDAHFRVFVDGAAHFEMSDFSIFNETLCDQTQHDRNDFRIVDELNSTHTSLYETMRGEITRVSIFDVEWSDEDILNGFFTCIDESVYQKPSFLWSDVFVDRYLAEFKRRPSPFCHGCPEPNLIQHALMYYDGTKNGDVLSYNCQNGYRLIGHGTSVCMSYGSWSHRTPRCRAYKGFELLQPPPLIKPNTLAENLNDNLIIHMVKFSNFS